jgi:hypothetical protein
MRNVVKELGTDNCGKAWNVLVAEWKLQDTDGSLAAHRIRFLVFPRDTRRKKMTLDSPRVLEAWIQKPFDTKALFGDICHADRSSHLAEGLSDPRTLTLCVVRGCAGVSPSGRPGKWENRGLAKLLVGYIEQWAIKSGIETLYGFISQYDDVEKLKHFWRKRGYVIGPVSEEEKRLHGTFYVAKATKKLQQ